MKEYRRLLSKVLSNGVERNDRTGVGTISLFGEQSQYDISDHRFPLVTSKRVPFKSVVYELLWMLSGSTNVKDLQAKGVTIWDEWASEDGNLGPIYGKQWRNFQGRDSLRVDQVQTVIHSIKMDPYSRRHIISAWNPAEIHDMALAPCHTLCQFYVHDWKLSCHLYQRSADIFLGVPFNIAQYALLTKIIAHLCRLQTDRLIISYGDVHLYKNHVEQAAELLSRRPFKEPALVITPHTGLKWYHHLDEIVGIDKCEEVFTLVGYKSHPPIYAEVAV